MGALLGLRERRFSTDLAEQIYGLWSNKLTRQKGSKDIGLDTVLLKEQLFRQIIII